MAIESGQTARAEDVLKLPAGGIYGDGSDGDVTISTNTSLSRDMYYDDLTVNESVILTANGYRIFVRNTLTNNGTIEANGEDAVAANQDEGPGGVAGATGSIGAGSDGGAGGGDASYSNSFGGGGGGGGGILIITARLIVNNGTISANGGDGADGYAGNPSNYYGTDTGSNSAAVDPGLGAQGGAGGSGRNTLGNTGSGGTSGTITAPAATEGGFRHFPRAAIMRKVSDDTFIYGGSGGGGGGSAWRESTDESAAGGGGGGGGGVVALIYQTLTDNGTISANGGAGGSGSTRGSGTCPDAATAGSNGIIIYIINAFDSTI